MQLNSKFLIIDTEGSGVLREIAVLDHQGSLVYEAFVAGHPRNQSIHHSLKPLKQIVQELAAIAFQKTIICHYAEHDRSVIYKSFQQAKIPQPQWTFLCTLELAKKYIPQVASYSLSHLSKILNLQVSNQFFQEHHAHTARYDAHFTYKLYCKLQQLQIMSSQLATIPNPFSSSRVDNPFQNHLDLQEVYFSEFAALKSVLLDVKTDPNQQSKGVVVIGEAGSGKTHLMMRLTKEFLKTNRLLFIRQPNHAQSIIHHTYSRILESFAEKVPDNNLPDRGDKTALDHTQLELLLANSLIKILNSDSKFTSSQKGRDILTALENDSLSLYKRLGTEGTQKNRDYWQFIENHINNWWTNKYTGAGYSAMILKGIIRFCSYTDPHKKELVRRWLAGNELESEEAASVALDNWHEDLSREEFALEAIGVFGRLSTLDEPLIIIFDQLEGLGLEHNRAILNSFGEAIKELLTHVPNSLMILNLFPDRWQQFQGFFDGSVVDRISQYIINLRRPPETKLKNILALKSQAVGLDIDTLFTPLELGDILGQKSIRAVLNHAAAYYRHKANGLPFPKPVPEVIPISEISKIDESIDNSSININSNLLARLEYLEITMGKIATLLLPFTQKENLKNSDVILSETFLEKKNLEPNIVEIYLAETRQILEQEYHQPIIIDDYDDIGKLTAIVTAFQRIQPIKTDQLRLGRNKLPENLVITINNQNYAIAFLNLGGSSFTAQIKKFNIIVSQNPQNKFYLIRDARESPITGKIGREEISKLDYLQNGNFLIFSKEQRINFELIYKLIIDIQEQDLEVDLPVALPILARYLQADWLIQILGEPLKN